MVEQMFLLVDHTLSVTVPAAGHLQIQPMRAWNQVTAKNHRAAWQLDFRQELARSKTIAYVKTPAIAE
ncbi:hypothetical protein D3C81_2024240 [compost metagenome]